MAPRNDLIAFCDLETTGPEFGKDDIIEVGLALYSWPEFIEVGSFTSIVTPTPEGWARMQKDDVVRKMHRANGLAEDIARILPSLNDAQYHLPENVDARIDRLLAPYGTTHIPLGGSGISHFDRPFIRYSLPRFDKRMTYWHYDVGVLRRMYLLMGAKPADDSGKTHRALDDARVHAQEFKFYADQIGKYAKLSAVWWQLPVIER